MSDNEKKGERPLTSPDHEIVIEKMTSDKPAIIWLTSNAQRPVRFLFSDFKPLSELPG